MVPEGVRRSHPCEAPGFKQSSVHMAGHGGEWKGLVASRKGSVKFLVLRRSLRIIGGKGKEKEAKFLDPPEFWGHL